MDDVTRRQALKLTATAGAIAAGVSALSGEAEAQDKGKTQNRGVDKVMTLQHLEETTKDFIRGVRAKLTIDNHTLTDLHVHWTGDVDGDDHWDFIQHGNSKTRDSRRVDIGNKATYSLAVYRNNDGNPGSQIGGDFKIKVKGGLADIAELIRQGDDLAYFLGSDVANIIIIGLLG